MQLRYVLVLLFATLGGCNRLTECESVSERQTIFLIDVTDEQLYYEIESDLKNHLPAFMDKTGMAGINACEKFTLSMIPITSREELEVSDASIAITRKGQSYQAVRDQSDPAPLVALMREKLNEFAKLTNDPEITSGSSIANVLLKAITQTPPGAKTTLVVFSDMIENNQYLNMYRKIPESDGIAGNLVDPLVLDAFQARKLDGIDVSILVVCKESRIRTVNASPRNVRQFWAEFFSELDLNNVRFIDNLTNI